MNLKIKATNINVTPDVQDYFEKKLSPLGKLIDIESDTVYIYAELEKNAHHNNGEIYRAEINLDSNGHHYYISKTGFDANGAIDMVTEELIEEVKLNKEKQRELSREGSAMAKEFIRSNDSEEIEVGETDSV